MQNSIECIEIPELIGGATFTNGGLLIYEFGKHSITNETATLCSVINQVKSSLLKNLDQELSIHIDTTLRDFFVTESDGIIVTISKKKDNFDKRIKTSGTIKSDDK
ncbi:hypothetical protein cand_007930 [Cryptosporidium andersoni]|uniref:Late endosomal/lysosomal adaptor and MAPK and MTOR activator 5 n=1 Tax=Cryptosporidium andersoni TaxID=117008 RepID=A0A1J4MPR5_9CRYT|nr:hypothetical protein cand_007930 [Cryptosporidium andersoni]